MQTEYFKYFKNKHEINNHLNETQYFHYHFLNE